MKPELSRLHRIDGLPKAGATVAVVATPEECAAVAGRIGIPALRSLVAKFRLHPVEGGAIAATATFSARLVRECVVSLEEFETTQRESFRLRFVPAGMESDDQDPESDDEIAFDGGMIDLGEVVVEQLALDLDPFPRTEGAMLPNDGEPVVMSPFAALAALRAKR
jgi:uncharacterized metal-binding protein YceD (DUF177 family)